VRGKQPSVWVHFLGFLPLRLGPPAGKIAGDCLQFGWGKTRNLTGTRQMFWQMGVEFDGPRARW